MEKSGSNSFIIVVMGASLEDCVDVTPLRELTYFNMRAQLSIGIRSTKLIFKLTYEGRTWSRRYVFFSALRSQTTKTKTTPITTIA